MRLIRITENENVDLILLLEKTYMARLTERIDDLEYYIQNNIMVRAFQQYSKEDHVPKPTDEEKRSYVEYFVEKYETWKADLVKDVDEVTQILLSNNTLEIVLPALTGSKKTPIAQCITKLTKESCKEENQVDIASLIEQFENAMRQLHTAKNLLKDYLTSKSLRS